jgi:SAM-dependent methyltransferase
LRLITVERRQLSVELTFQVVWTAALAALMGPWTGAEVRIGGRWLNEDGFVADADAPRTDPVDLRWLRFMSARRTLTIRGAESLEHGSLLAVELVAEGVSWGSDVGLRRLHVSLADAVPSPPALGRSRGPSPPEERAAVIRDWLASARPQDAPELEMTAYLDSDLSRFLMTAQLLRRRELGRTLEIGAGPYFTTRLLERFCRPAALTLTNFFGTASGRGEQALVDRQGEEVARYGYDLVDVETTPLPYADGSFDTVLFCEVLEHLIVDPLFALGEIHRVLAPDGQLLLTTPNVARATNVRRMRQNMGIYDPYSRYGPHGRHNREYSSDELFEILEGSGLVVRQYLTRPVHFVREADSHWFAAADDLGDGDYHFVLCGRTERPDGFGRPGWLYR